LALVAANEVTMPKAPAKTTDADQQPAPAPADAPERADNDQGAIARLAATFQALQARHDELLHRFLTLIDERRALDRALFAERFKTAGLQRDLGVFQRQWHTAQAELTEIQAQNDHHKTLCLELQQQVLEAREQRDQHEKLSQRLQQELEEARAQRDQQVQMNKDLQQELHEIRHSKIWQLGQKYWKLTGQKGI
jgi:chromosome segregation ATPase